MTIPTVPACSDREAFEAKVFAFLCRKYVQRADARQQGMGLQYMEAETHDLARQVAALAHARQTPDPSAARIAELEGALRDSRSFVQAIYEDRVATYTTDGDFSTLSEEDGGACGEAMRCLSRINAALTPTATPPGEARDE